VERQERKAAASNAMQCNAQQRPAMQSKAVERQERNGVHGQARQGIGLQWQDWLATIEKGEINYGKASTTASNNEWMAMENWWPAATNRSQCFCR
jgi:hypothetical protein